MRISNIRVPHLGQDGHAMTWGKIRYRPSLRLPHYLAYRCTESFLQVEATIDTLTFQWLPLNDIVHRTHNTSEMGNNRRTIEDQRAKPQRRKRDPARKRGPSPRGCGAPNRSLERAPASARRVSTFA
jgi:hypothetical protein